MSTLSPWLKRSSVQRFRLGQGCFIKVISNKDLLFGWVEAEKVDRIQRSLLERAVKQLGAEVIAKDVSFKIIVPQFLKAALKAADFGNFNVEIVYRTDLDSEIIYDPKSKRAVIEKAAPLLQSPSVEPAPVTTVKKIKVLIVEDSKTVRGLLTKILAKEADIEVIGGVESAEEAEDFLKNHKVDVLTLDINLPGIDGAELLKRIYPVYKIPTILITSLTLGQSSKVFEALEAGAIDYIQKPEFAHLAEQGQMIIEKVKVANEANITKSAKSGSRSRDKELRFNLESLIVVGSSTGGTNAVADILEQLPPEIPPILVVQHIPPLFSKSFAERLNQVLPFKVKEAEDGDIVEKNTVLVAPGGMHMRLEKRDRHSYKVSIVDAPPVNRFKPSVDYFFGSVGEIYEGNLIATILTGMGKDGARAMLELKNKGFHTIAQDKNSCVVYGMPRAAVELGAANHVLPLNDIAQMWCELSQKGSSRKRSA